MASETIITRLHVQLPWHTRPSTCACTKSRDFGNLIGSNLRWRHVPTGKHQIHFWQASAGYISSVKINGVAIEWTGGCLKVNIVPNETIKLGVVEVPSAVFEKN